MTDIYDQHKAAFARIEAFVILKDGARVATIAFKFPANGAGPLYAYVQYIGMEMVRGYAGGGGYNKRSAACCAAAVTLGKDRSAAFAAPFVFALLDGDRGAGWDRCLRDAGFTVLQAV